MTRWVWAGWTTHTFPTEILGYTRRPERVCSEAGNRPQPTPFPGKTHHRNENAKSENFKHTVRVEKCTDVKTSWRLSGRPLLPTFQNKSLRKSERCGPSWVVMRERKLILPRTLDPIRGTADRYSFAPLWDTSFKSDLRSLRISMAIAFYFKRSRTLIKCVRIWFRRVSVHIYRHKFKVALLLVKGWNSLTCSQVLWRLCAKPWEAFIHWRAVWFCT